MSGYKNMNSKQLKRSKLGKRLILLVGARKAVRLLRSLYTCKDVGALGLNLEVDSLWGAFLWRESPQGKRFWIKLAEHDKTFCDNIALRDHQLHFALA